MNFEFATANRIIFGPGKIEQLPSLTLTLDARVLFVTGSGKDRAQAHMERLRSAGSTVEQFAIPGEPSIEAIQSGVQTAKRISAGLVIGFGGGSPIDAAKAIAALTTNPGDPLDYLEVIGGGQPLTKRPLPSIAVPTTAGTGAEVTKNAVLASPEHRVKVSLRHPLMLPDVALVDPTLTRSTPPRVTASTGLDALTQLIEPLTCCRATPLTDGFCREGIGRASRSLERAFRNGEDIEAREDMALASLLGGLSLANSGLGAVHGFAGPIGGMYSAPHGAVCAALLPHVMRANVAALSAREPGNPVLGRYREIANTLTQSSSAEIDDGINWVEELCSTLDIASLSDLGIQEDEFPIIVEKATRSSSMKANPITLTARELTSILAKAF